MSPAGFREGSERRGQALSVTAPLTRGVSSLPTRGWARPVASLAAGPGERPAPHGHVFGRLTVRPWCLAPGHLRPVAPDSFRQPIQRAGGRPVEGLLDEIAPAAPQGVSGVVQMQGAERHIDEMDESSRIEKADAPFIESLPDEATQSFGMTKGKEVKVNLRGKATKSKLTVEVSQDDKRGGPHPSDSSAANLRWDPGS